MIRVVVADDQQLIRAGFRVLLDSEDDIEVVDGAAVVDLGVRLRPDVVLLDIRMPGMGGIEATRQIAEQAVEEVRVLIVTTYEVDEYVFDAIRAGASGFLLKDTDPVDLLRAVRVGRARRRGRAVPRRHPPADGGLRQRPTRARRTSSACRC